MSPDLSKARPPVAEVQTPVRLDWGLALLAGLAALALYLRTLAPGLLWGDSGEFQFAAWLGGFVHPTGYPLYLALGWLWTHLFPGGDPAWRMNVFSAAWGGVAAGLTYLVALRALRLLDSPADRPAHLFRRLVALCAAFTFAVTPTFWSQAVVAEVYTLHAAFVAALLLALVAWAERPAEERVRAVYGVALVYGLSLAHHRTTLLLFPAIAVFLWFGRARAGRRFGRRNLAIATGLLLAPLLLYLIIPLRAPQAPYFQLMLGAGRALPLYDASIGGFFAHISGSTFSAALGGGGGLGPALAGLAGRFVRELSYPGVALGLVGASWLAWLAARPAEASRRRNRAAWLALTLLVFLATVGFNLLYGIGDIFVFYIPAYLVWVLWVCAGVWACGRACVWGLAHLAAAGGGGGSVADRPQREGPRRGMRMVYVSAGLIALLLPALLAVRSFAANDRSKDDTARVAWESILAQPIPQGTILVSNDRDEMVPQWYLKYVEGRRPDLDGLFPLIQPGPAWSDVAAVVEQALTSGRPVALIKPMPGLEVKFGLEPFAAGANAAVGGVVRVLGPAGQGEFARSSGAVFGERLRLAGYDVQPATVGAGRELEVVLYWEPLAALDHDYTTFVHLLNAAGAVVGQSDQRPGGVYYSTSLWRPGDRLRDAHRVSVSADPGAGPFTLEVGVYRLAPDLQHLGAPQRVGELAGS